MKRASVGASRQPHGVSIVDSLIDTDHGDIVGRDKIVIKKAFLETVLPNNGLADRTLRSEQKAALGPPRLLPYLTNRREQQQFMTEIFQSILDVDAIHPLSFFVTGSDDECVDSFIEQLRYVWLPNLLRSNDLSPEILFHNLRWPDFTAEGEPYEEVNMTRDLEQQIKAILRLRSTAEQEAVRERLLEASSSFCFQVNIDVSQWPRRNWNILRAWFRWWDGMNLKGNSKYPIITMFSVAYRAGLFYRLLSSNSIARFHRKSNKILNDPEFRATVYTLPALRKIGFPTT